MRQQHRPGVKWMSEGWHLNPCTGHGRLHFCRWRTDGKSSQLWQLRSIFFMFFSSAGDQAFQKLQRNLRQHGSDSVRRLWICWICMDLSQEWSFHGLCSCMIFVYAGQCFHAPCQGAVLLCRTFAEKRGIELRGQHRAKETLMSNMSSWTA